MAWNSKVKVKHLLTEHEDQASVQASMNAIADEIENHSAFVLFRDVHKFRSIPQGDDVFGPVDYANRLLDGLYDFADEHRIWIE